MIIAAAIFHRGTIYTLPKPARHSDIIKLINEKTGIYDQQAEQGFLDDMGQFMRRKRALMEAQKCQQLLPRATCSGGNLFSEDVW